MAPMTIGFVEAEALMVPFSVRCPVLNVEAPAVWFIVVCAPRMSWLVAPTTGVSAL